MGNGQRNVVRSGWFDLSDTVNCHLAATDLNVHAYMCDVLLQVLVDETNCASSFRISANSIIPNQFRGSAASPDLAARHLGHQSPQCERGPINKEA